MRSQFLSLDISGWEENYVDLNEMQELIYNLEDVECSNVAKLVHL